MHLRQLIDELGHDVKFGVRQLAGTPLFTSVAILTLALGIGANAAVFGVVKSVLLDALPYRDAERLVRVWGGVSTTPQIGPLPAATVSELESRARSFTQLAAFAYQPNEGVVVADGAPLVAWISWVEPAFFDTLGVVAALGRTFAADEGGNGLVPLSGGQLGTDTARVAVLSDMAWRERFAGDLQILGREVRVNGTARTIVGVLPRGFVAPMGAADIFLPVDLGPVADHAIFGRGSGWLGLVGRLAPGVSMSAARGEVAAIWAEFARRYPEENGSLGIDAVPLRDAMVGETRTPLLILIASAALVLLIACANLASALLSRALGRRRELAVRAALGAGRRRLVRQLLTESTLLALSGGAAGLLLALAALRLARTLAAPVLPPYADLTLYGGAIAVTAVVAMTTGILFGVAPAMLLSRREVQSALRDESRGVSEGRRSRQLRGLLMAGQVALCISLLAGAGLLARSLWTMTTAPIGIDPTGVLTATIRLPASDYPTPDASAAFLNHFLERLAGLPGVESVASTISLPTGDSGQTGMTFEGTAPDAEQPFVRRAIVSDDYFRLLRIPLRDGRTFDVRDLWDGPRVAVVSAALARRFFPAGDALGARMRLGPNPNAPWTEVIGVVGDVRDDLTRPDAAPMLYVSSRQAAFPSFHVLVRTSSDPLALAVPVERTLAALDRGLPLQRPETLESVVGRGFTGRQLPAFLMIAFGALALVLASVGIYAMFANLTASRAHEFGIRMALGSRPREIVLLVLRQGAGWVALGLAGGTLGVMTLARFVRGLLYGVTPFDPLTMSLVLALLLACAATALLVPLRRATRVDPTIALRA
jgi:predicted permease